MITAKELHSLNLARHAQNEQRVEAALDSALKKLELRYDQRIVNRMYVPNLKGTDRVYVESLMADAGYANVSFFSQNDGRNGTDVHISFEFPPFTE